MRSSTRSERIVQLRRGRIDAARSLSNHLRVEEGLLEHGVVRGAV